MFGKCIHRSNDTNMCTFMVDFIKKLKTGMYMREMMNVVLEHLGVLQVSVVGCAASVDIHFVVETCRRWSPKTRTNCCCVLHISSKSANHLRWAERNRLPIVCANRTSRLFEPPLFSSSKSKPIRLCRYTDHSLSLSSLLFFSIVMFCFFVLVFSSHYSSS